MRVTASQIADWANTNAKQAQADLPRWVRRLCFDSESTRQLSFPAGDSNFVPGWDGMLFSERGNAWVPAGSSRWEIGCDKDVGSKANGDYQKRTEKTPQEERSSCTFVFVTPRRWIGKSAWIKSQKSKGEWAAVAAYDADDLEQWLEQTPAVALAFSEALGLSGWGITSLAKYWDGWSKQCSPTITPEAFFTDRSDVVKTLTEKTQGLLRSPQVGLFSIQADSVEEAAAFSVAVILGLDELADQAVVITDPQGWRFVDANPNLKIAIVARTEFAASPVIRDGLVLIVPHARGDLAAKFKGDQIVIDRPNIYDFEKALIAIGTEESDAKRYALSTGRSWTVLRRQRATNPAIQRPRWLDSPQSESLTVLCLLGAWLADSPADQQLVERLASRPYEEIERDLRQLAHLDDAPLLSIGAVWKAKSPLELLSQCGDQITRALLDRFFSVALETLSAPDPQLELPDRERWIANVHGKVHPHSGLLVESLCDSLTKLAVRGPDIAGLQALNIEERVAGLIRKLLEGADTTRWLSLASYLPTLAEAAPDEFIRVVQQSLGTTEAPVVSLITETGDSGLMGRCWHAGLLWALESLGWATRHLAPVTLILAQLCHVPMKGNWGNKPSASLLGLYRSWFPQTAASLSDRIKVLQLLIGKEPEVAFCLLVELVEEGPQTASGAHRPKWRDDDAGAGQGATVDDMYQMLEWAGVQLLHMSAGYATRIVTVLERTLFRRPEELHRILPLTEPFIAATASDEDREVLRDAFRHIMHWHRSYDDAPPSELSSWLDQVDTRYEQLAPTDLVLRHRWLFNNDYPDLAFSSRGDDYQAHGRAIAQLRESAITEIYRAMGISGIELLAEKSSHPGLVGQVLPKVPLAEVCWFDWIMERGGELGPTDPMTACFAGLLRTLPSTLSIELLRQVIGAAEENEWPSERIARLLALGRAERQIWAVADSCNQEVSESYWRRVQLYPWADSDDELKLGVRRLLDANRPLAALQYCQYSLDRTDPQQLYLALQKLLSTGGEVDGPKISSWHLAEMLKRLETSGEIEQMALAQLEFGLFPLLRYGRETRANALFEAVMTEPELFKQLICLSFKPQSGEREEATTDANRETASRAWSVLHACTRLPGTQSNGQVDETIFNSFVDEARELCRLADRSTVADVILGQILAHAPAAADGTWPISVVKDLLDRPELEEMRRGFSTGTRNKRGVTSRSPFAGGDQERELACRFRGLSENSQFSYPNFAATLELIAKSYEHEARREDIEANLRKESF